MIVRNEQQYTMLAVFPGTHLPPIKIAPGDKALLNGDFELYRDVSRETITEVIKPPKSQKNWQRLQGLSV